MQAHAINATVTVPITNNSAILYNIQCQYQRTCNDNR